MDLCTRQEIFFAPSPFGNWEKCKCRSGYARIGAFPDVFANDATFGFLQFECVDADVAAFRHYSMAGMRMDAAEPIGPRS